MMSIFLAYDIERNSPRQQVIEDIHALAYLYHWRAEDVWNMPCQERRVFVDRVLKQLRDENRKAAKSGKSSTKPKKYVDNLHR